MSELMIAQENGVALVTINRPQKRNAMALEQWRGLAAAFRGFAADDAVRTAVLFGAGGHFCAGADIGEFEAVRRNASDNDVYSAAVTEAAASIMELEKPVIAAIEGSVFGGGCGLAMACDMRIAAKGARFAVPAAKLSIVYTPRDTANLLSLVGPAWAKRILFTGDPIDAETALRIGLADQLVEENPLAAARALAERISANAPLSIAGAKAILRALLQGKGADEVGQRMTARSLDSEDFREGRRAFMEKRKPKFLGR